MTTVVIQGRPPDDWPGQGQYEWGGLGSRVVADDGFEGIACGALADPNPYGWVIDVRGPGGERRQYEPWRLVAG